MPSKNYWESDASHDKLTYLTFAGSTTAKISHILTKLEIKSFFKPLPKIKNKLKST